MNSNSHVMPNDMHSQKKEYFPPKSKNYNDSRHQYYNEQNKGYSSKDNGINNNYKKYYHSSTNTSNYNSSINKYNNSYNSINNSSSGSNKISCHILLNKSHYSIIDKNIDYLKNYLRSHVKDVIDIQHDYTVSYYDDYVLKISVYPIKSKTRCIFIVSDFLYKELEKKYSKMSYIKISILIADNVIGNVIGLEGKNINTIREQTSTRIDVFNEVPKAKYRKIEIVGDPYSISQACEKIFSIEEKYINFYYNYGSSISNKNISNNNKNDLYYNVAGKNSHRSRSRSRSRGRSHSYKKNDNMFLYEKNHEIKYEKKRYNNNNYRYNNYKKNNEYNNMSHLDDNNEDEHHSINNNYMSNDKNNIEENGKNENNKDKQNIKDVNLNNSEKEDGCIDDDNDLKSDNNNNNSGNINNEIANNDNNLNNESINNNDNLIGNNENSHESINEKDENYKLELLFLNDVILKLKSKEENILNHIQEKNNCLITETDCLINDENMKIISFYGNPENNSKAIHELQQAILSFLEN